MPAYFTSSTKRELKISILLGMSPPVTTLKTPFSSSLIISFCLDVVYSAGGVSAFLINTSNSSIQKQIFDRVTTLAYSGYFLGRPWPCLTKAEEAKVVEGDSHAVSIEVTSAQGASV